MNKFDRRIESLDYSFRKLMQLETMEQNHVASQLDVTVKAWKAVRKARRNAGMDEEWFKLHVMPAFTRIEKIINDYENDLFEALKHGHEMVGALKGKMIARHYDLAATTEHTSDESTEEEEVLKIPPKRPRPT